MAEEKIIRVNPNYKYWEVFRLSGPEEWEFWGRRDCRQRRSIQNDRRISSSI